MITCTDLHGKACYVNPDLIESIEVTPDTQLVFVNGHRMYVSETPEEIVDRIVEFRRLTGCGRPPAWLQEEKHKDEKGA
jgi:flagellar protein FlbD